MDNISDEDLRSDKSAENILVLFDNADMRIKKDGTFENGVYDTPQKGDDQCIANCFRKVAEMRRYENNVGVDLPGITQGKLVLRQANLNAPYQYNIATWFETSAVSPRPSRGSTSSISYFQAASRRITSLMKPLPDARSCSRTTSAIGQSRRAGAPRMRETGSSIIEMRTSSTTSVKTRKTRAASGSWQRTCMESLTSRR